MWNLLNASDHYKEHAWCEDLWFTVSYCNISCACIEREDKIEEMLVNCTVILIPGHNPSAGERWNLIMSCSTLTWIPSFVISSSLSPMTARRGPCMWPSTWCSDKRRGVSVKGTAHQPLRMKGKVSSYWGPGYNIWPSLHHTMKVTLHRVSWERFHDESCLLQASITYVCHNAYRTQYGVYDMSLQNHVPYRLCVPCTVIVW